jgi:Bifunctional DNA primase/polymerase, N-terminal
MSHAVFSNAQPIYAERGIATFPVTESKAPAVRGYLRLGLDTSRGLVIKFPDAPALGFATKRRNGVTILDIDTPDEKVLADALDRHGHTPLIARTGSGKFHAYYRHNGERCHRHRERATAQRASSAHR